LQASIEDAITAYDARRRPETAAVVQSNRQAGPHRCQDLVEERAPGGFTDLDEVVSQQELGEIAEDYKRIAGFAIDSLNNRPSLSIRCDLHAPPSPIQACMRPTPSVLSHRVFQHAGSL